MAKVSRRGAPKRIFEISLRHGKMDKLTLETIAERFGKATERRIELYERIEAWLQAANATQILRRVWLFGSFVSDKPGPGNLDILALFAAGFDPIDFLHKSSHSTRQVRQKYETAR